MTTKTQLSKFGEPCLDVPSKKKGRTLVRPFHTEAHQNKCTSNTPTAYQFGYPQPVTRTGDNLQKVGKEGFITFWRCPAIPVHDYFVIFAFRTMVIKVFQDCNRTLVSIVFCLP